MSRWAWVVGLLVLTGCSQEPKDTDWVLPAMPPSRTVTVCIEPSPQGCLKYLEKTEYHINDQWQ